jgi:hypothetical protein
MDGFGAPQFYRVEIHRCLLGAGYLYSVRMNNHTDVSWHDTMGDASLEAARRNYVENCGYGPRIIGLDGVD